MSYLQKLHTETEHKITFVHVTKLAKAFHMTNIQMFNALLKGEYRNELIEVM